MTPPRQTVQAPVAWAAIIGRSASFARNVVASRYIPPILRCTNKVSGGGTWANSRSVPMGAAVEQVRLLAGNGYREVVITGVDSTSWGKDLPGS
ncbi:MAG: hypothetical protein ACO3VR_05945, partial [Lutimaribacter sp.]